MVCHLLSGARPPAALSSALALAAGLIAGEAGGVIVAAFLPAAALAGLAAACLARGRVARRAGPLAPAAAADLTLLCLFVVLGALRGGDAAQRWEREARWVGAQAGPAWVRVRTAHRPGGGHEVWLEALRPCSERRYLVPHHPIRLGGGPGAGPLGGSSAGKRWIGFARLDASRGPRFPGDWDRRADDRSRGRAGTLRDRGLRPVPASVGTSAPDERAWPRRLDPGGLRHALAARLARRIPGAGGPLAATMLLGRQAGLAEADSAIDTLQRAGVGHLLAVSGLHVGLVAALLVALARLLPGRRGGRACLVTAGLLGYATLVGWSASVTRAALALAAWSLLRAGGRRPRPTTLWALLLAGCLWVQPGAWRAGGFQLSYLVSLALLGAVGSGQSAAARFGGKRGSARRGRAGRQRRWARAALAAQAVAWPLLLAHGGAVSPLHLAGNLLLVPIAVLLIGLLPTALLLGCLPGFPGTAVGAGFGWALEGFLRVAEWIGSGAQALSLGAELSIGWALLLSALGAGIWRVRRLPRRACLGVALLCAGAAAWLGNPPRRLPAAVMVDVGQGEAWVLLSRRETWLVDLGPPPGEAGRARRCLTRTLHAYGRHRITRLFLTHPDRDHCGGLAELLAEGLAVDSLHLPALWAGAAGSAGVGSSRQLALLREQGSGQRTLARGARVRGSGLEAHILHPPRGQGGQDGSGPLRDDNARGLALSIRLGDLRILVAGDAPSAVEESWELGAARGRVDLLSAAHHGSAGSTPMALLRRAAPHAVLISAGRNNLYGHPSRAVLDRCQRRGIGTWCTASEGSLVIRRTRAGWQIRGTASGRSQILARDGVLRRPGARRRSRGAGRRAPVVTHSGAWY